MGEYIALAGLFLIMVGLFSANVGFIVSNIRIKEYGLALFVGVVSAGIWAVVAGYLIMSAPL